MNIFYFSLVEILQEKTSQTNINALTLTQSLLTEPNLSHHVVS